jgi:alpha-amylase/alpha-mannosidase (GH57 family)
MGSRARLAFLWHMHQPLYRAPDTGEFLLPWVRLHATRAYYDMGWMLERHPEIRCTVNFTPVLMEQLEVYARGEARDHFLEVSGRRARDLLPEERQAILRSFFMVDWETAVKPLPRYWDLLQKRGRDVRYLDLERVAKGFSDDEIADLQVLFNLAWFGFGAVEDDEGLRELVKKGRAYSEEDLQYVLEVQQRIVREIVPRWRALAERGQVELSTTPYYHPILPLVCDTDSARRALPGVALPPRYSWPQDARWHVREALAAHARHFGRPAVGMWPAEGSVSPEALEILAGEGVRWAATDEGVLLHSLAPETQRLRALYRPWRVNAGGGGEIAMLFRDRGLSDLIGFSYARTPAADAAADFISHLEAIGGAWGDERQSGPATVGVFLDGENPWEHFPRSGRDFLEALYRRLETSQDVRTATMTEATADAPGPSIPRIHSGSWIESSFRIWMGHEEDRRAWTALGRAREALARAVAAPEGIAPSAIAAAHRHLYAAEGSDWYWWYGDDFHTELAAEFDGLFRSLVVSACQAIGAPLPIEALEPIKRLGAPQAESKPSREPTFLITPTIDGRETTYFEWQGGGLYRPGQTRGAMFGGAQAFHALRYGFDLQHLYLRLDPVEVPQRTAELCSTVRVEAVAADLQAQVDFEVCPDGAERRGRRAGAELGRGAFARIVELAIPFAELKLARGDRLALAVHVLRGDVELERFPRFGYLTLTVPDEDFERIHWRV